MSVTEELEAPPLCLPSRSLQHCTPSLTPVPPPASPGIPQAQHCFKFRFERIPAGLVHTLIFFSPNMPQGCGKEGMLTINMQIHANDIKIRVSQNKRAHQAIGAGPAGPAALGSREGVQQWLWRPAAEGRGAETRWPSFRPAVSVASTGAGSGGAVSEPLSGLRQQAAAVCVHGFSARTPLLTESGFS